jgi:hypothetical protein
MIVARWTRRLSNIHELLLSVWLGDARVRAAQLATVLRRTAVAHEQSAG